MAEHPSARAPMRVRLPRALKEYAAVPVLVVVGLQLVAALSIVGDQASGAFFRSVRGVLAHYIGAQTASNTLAAVATGLVTVTSITFSVLLLAVQQTASNLSPVVFDQFVRRRANQLYLGLFVGLALYAFIVMAAVQPKTPPIIGAFIATVLTAFALVSLLFLVYSTIHQMRPDNVMRQLHDRAARAHDRETALVRRTRRRPASKHPVRAEYRCPTYGYVESVDLERIIEALDPVEGAEVEIRVTVGQEVAVGDLLARVRHPETPAAERIVDRLASAMPISSTPDLDYDPRTAVRDIGNIGWTSGSTSKQNPAIARQALHAIRDLAARWLLEGERSGPDPAPVVYGDHDVGSILDVLYSMVVVARESRQYQQAVQVLKAYEQLWPMADRETQERIRHDVVAMQSVLDQMPASPRLAEEREQLAALVSAGDRSSGTHSHEEDALRSG